VSLYQVQRGQLRRRAQQLTSERLALKERTEKLIRLLPQLAPQLEKLPQWNRLVDTEGSTSAGNSTISFDFTSNRCNRSCFIRYHYEMSLYSSSF